MKLGISQPTFLPWAGYFGLISYTGKFVILDNIRFNKRSWQQRNNIKLNDTNFLLTVPVISKNKFKQNINEVMIDKKRNFVDNHIKIIEHNYKRSKYYNLYSNLIFDAYSSKHNKLIDLNLCFIKLICEILEIKFSYILSSSLQITESKDQLILDICKKMKCKEYVSTIGAKEYLRNEDNFNTNDIRLNFFGFKNSNYQQLGTKFLKNLSIIDLLFNLGPNTLQYITENFYIYEKEN